MCGAMLVLALLGATIVIAGDSTSDDFAASLNMGNADPIIDAVVVQNSGEYSPTAGTTTEAAVRMTVTDANGWEDINITAGSGTNCTVAKGGVTRTLGTCSKISNSSATTAIFECVGNMNFYDLTGADWAVTCTAVDNVGASDNDSVETMTYNRLESIADLSAISWTGITPSSTDVAAVENPVTLENQGNAYFAKVNATGIDLEGADTPAELIAASDFSVNVSDAMGMALSNATSLEVASAALLIGESAEEDLYFYLDQVTTPVSSQVYNSIANWEVTVHAAANTNP
jgi:hypothetical protein